MMLQIRNLSKNFGGLQAVSNLDLSVKEGEVKGIIGPNGSGKTTLFNLINGIYKPDEGKVIFLGEDITGFEPYEVAERGIGRTFQLLRIFPEMTVLENLLVGRHVHVKYGLISSAFGSKKSKDEERKMKDEMMEILGMVGLEKFSDVLCSQLSIGQRRLVQLARAISMKPKLLLLDEPAAGLSPVNIEVLMNLLKMMVTQLGFTIVIVEHIMKVVMEISDTIAVLDYGEKISEGSPEKVKNDPKVIEAYLGEELEDEAIRRMLM